MPDEESTAGWKETLLGFGIILLAIAAVFYSSRFVYLRYFGPVPAVVSLSAYFVDDAGAPVSSESPNYEKSHIRIKGDVSQDGQPIKAGGVRVTVSSTKNDLFQQSVSLPRENAAS